MIIWHEYRLHAMVFTLRCCSVYAFGLLNQAYPEIYNTHAARAAQFVLIVVHHLVVDKITEIHGPMDPTQTTVRVDGDSGPITKAVLRFYAFYQFCAMGSHLVPNGRLLDLGYNALIAI